MNNLEDKIFKLLQEQQPISVKENETNTIDQVKRYIDLAYLIGVFNVSGIDGLLKELARLEKIGKHPYDILIHIEEGE